MFSGWNVDVVPSEDELGSKTPDPPPFQPSFQDDEGGEEFVADFDNKDEFVADFSESSEFADTVEGGGAILYEGC